MTSLPLARQVFSLELRRLAMYRTQFWVQVLGGITIHVLIAYYLWQALFAASGAALMGGYTFKAMMFYYVSASFVYQAVQPQMGMVSQEIFDGSLSKYLIYPCSYFIMKFLGQAARALLVALQYLLAVFLFVALFGVPEGYLVNLSTIGQSLLLTGLALVLYFLVAIAIECCAFWLDVIWNLLVMFQFIVTFLGGRLVPLSLFPSWAQDVLSWSPFPYMISVPARAMMGKVSNEELLQAALVLIAWIIVMYFVARAVYRRGLKSFTGVGL